MGGINLRAVLETLLKGGMKMSLESAVFVQRSPVCCDDGAGGGGFVLFFIIFVLRGV